MIAPLSGACHCGAVRAELRPGRPADEIAVRACQCSFCRRHGAATASDASGALILRSRAPLVRYRFGSRATDVLLCGVCGIYAAGAIEDEGRLFATVNVAGLAMAPLNARLPEPADYGGEDPAVRRARRLKLWTPLTLKEAEAPT